MNGTAARLGRVLALLATCALGCSDASSAQSQGGTVVCEQPYALCSHAPCRPIPGDPTNAVCDCDVEDGVNLGGTACDQRAMKPGPYGLTELTSAFSLVDVPLRPLITCPAGTVWTQCLDAPCFVDPSDARRAVCTCTVQTSGIPQTFGGNCDVATCATSFWSAATSAQIEGGLSALAQYLGIAPPPVQLCPGS